MVVRVLVFLLTMAAAENRFMPRNQPLALPNRNVCSNIDNLRREEMYPPIEPFHAGYLKVWSVHKMYYEQCGNKNGIPIVFLRGGPGCGISEYYRRYFDPKAYHIIFFDQRGAGKSTPSYSLEENDTWSVICCNFISSWIDNNISTG